MIVTYCFCPNKKGRIKIDMNGLILGIEALINWLGLIVKWTLITAIGSLILMIILMCTLHVLKINNIKIPKFN